MSTLRWVLLAALGIAGLWLYFGWPIGTDVEDGSYLLVDVSGEYVEWQPPAILERLLGRKTRPLTALLSELTKAERDERIAGVVVRFRSSQLGWAKAQEIRDALLRLKAAGKRVVAYLEVERYGGNLEYYIASATDYVAMAPGARNPFVGLASEAFYLGGLFEKVGIELEYERIGRWKSAPESFADTGSSEAAREMNTWLLDSIEAQLVAGIAQGRSLDVAEVRRVIDTGPASGEEMRAAGLVDDVTYLRQVLEREGSPTVVRASEYAAVDAASVGFEPEATFALIYGAGAVVTGEGQIGQGGQPVLASATVSKAIRDAAASDEVRAIVLRIDSPGGSALASDLVWDAIREARKKGKPVVASLSDVAASGGYYVACAADKIVAEPATLTGSIGVFVLRPVLGGLLEKLGIGVESSTRGELADLLLSTRTLREETRERMRVDIQAIYDLFVARVAESRGMEPEAVDAVGRGRVFTGEQALEAGLIDALGGYKQSVREAKILAGLDPEADVVLVTYPPPKPLAEQLMEALGTVRALSAFDPQTLLPASAASWLEILRRHPTGGPLLVPPLLPEIR